MTQVKESIPVSLNFSGGISLGAYMAGIFYELTKEATEPESGITVDIITGASAGAISSVLAAYYLLGAEPLPADARESLFYKAWVEEVSIQQLIPKGMAPEVGSATGQANWSLLSGKFVEELSERLIGGLREKLAEAHPDKPSFKPLALLVTLTNLQGFLKETTFPLKADEDPDSCEVAVEMPQPADDTHIETITNAETRQFLFHEGLAYDQIDALWKKTELSARASGAFPVAFPPIGDDSDVNSPNLAMLSQDYLELGTKPGARRLRKGPDGAVIDPLRGIAAPGKTETHLQFQYTDGAVLDGLPLVKAIALESALLEAQSLAAAKPLLSESAYAARKQAFLEQYPLCSDQRFEDFLVEWAGLGFGDRAAQRLYVYIQPAPTNDLNSRPSLTKSIFSMLEVGLSALTLSKSEHDAIRLTQIRQRNEDARRKKALLEKIQGAEFDGVRETLTAAIEEAIPYRPIKLCRIDPSLLSTALSEEWKGRFPSVHKALNGALPGYMRDAIAQQDEVVLLASDFLGSFGGFFDQTYRDHDFLLGRLCGQLCLLENVWTEADDADPRVQALVELIHAEKGHFLAEDPKPGSLIEGGISTIERLVWRFVRILLKGLCASRNKKAAEASGGQALAGAVLTQVALKGIGILSLILSLSALVIYVVYALTTTL